MKKLLIIIFVALFKVSIQAVTARKEVTDSLDIRVEDFGEATDFIKFLYQTFSVDVDPQNFIESFKETVYAIPNGWDLIKKKYDDEKTTKEEKLLSKLNMLLKHVNGTHLLPYKEKKNSSITVIKTTVKTTTTTGNPLNLINPFEIRRKAIERLFQNFKEIKVQYNEVQDSVSEQIGSVKRFYDWMKNSASEKLTALKNLWPF